MNSKIQSLGGVVVIQCTYNVVVPQDAGRKDHISNWGLSPPSQKGIFIIANSYNVIDVIL